MNDVSIIVLVAIGMVIIAYAELQSETNVVRAILENRGVKTTQKDTRASLNADPLYRQSNLYFIIFIIAFIFSLWIFKNHSGAWTTVAILSIICTASLACTVRAMALIRVINRIQAKSTSPR